MPLFLVALGTCLSAGDLAAIQSLIERGDLAAAEQEGWPVEDPEAYPGIMRLKPGKVLTSPTSEELALLEACLRAIPAFMHQREPLTTTVPLTTGPIELTLSWIDGG